MEPIDVIARTTRHGACGTGPAGPAPLHVPFMAKFGTCPPTSSIALQPSLEFARAPGETSRWAVVFRAVVVETAAEHAVLHGDMLLPLKLVRERRSHLKQVGRGHGPSGAQLRKLYAAEGHDGGATRAARHLVLSLFDAAACRRWPSARCARARLGSAREAWKTEVVNSTLQREAQGARNTSAVEQAAGLVKERTFEDGKSMFRGVGQIVDEAAQWAVISGNVFLDVSTHPIQMGASRDR